MPAINSYMPSPKTISVLSELFGLARRRSTIEGNYRGDIRYRHVIDRVAKKLEGASTDKSGNKCVSGWGLVKSTRKQVGKQEEESVPDSELHTAHALLIGRNVYVSTCCRCRVIGTFTYYSLLFGTGRHRHVRASV